MRISNIYILLVFFIALNIKGYGQIYNSDSTSSKHLHRISQRKLTKRVVNHYFEYKNLSFKIDAKIETPTKSYNLNIIYRNYRDSIIWININHNTGIPVARILLTADSTKVLNRLEKNYLLMSNKQIVNKFNYEITFDMIQSVFMGELLNLDSDKELLQVYSHYKVYIDSSNYVLQNIKKNKIDRLLRRDKIDEYFIHQNIINSAYKLVSMSLKNNSKKQEIEVNYTINDSQKPFPKRINIVLANKDGNTLIDMKIKKAKFDKDNLSTSFKIPKKYERVMLKKTSKSSSSQPNNNNE